MVRTCCHIAEDSDLKRLEKFVTYLKTVTLKGQKNCHVPKDSGVTLL